MCRRPGALWTVASAASGSGSGLAHRPSTRVLKSGAARRSSIEENRFQTRITRGPRLKTGLVDWIGKEAV